jgi:type I restriction enzyme M protein
MTEQQKKELQTQLRNIANELRGKMNADEFRDYILGFIFYKYLSEKMYLYANKLLKEDEIDFTSIDEATADGQLYLTEIRRDALDELGYFLKPSDLFRSLTEKGNAKTGEDTFIMEDLTRILNSVEQSTMGTESEDDFDKLFSELDLTSSKL